MYFDNHNHSQFSFDGERTSVEKTSREALGKGLGGICFTDHCDFFVPPVKGQDGPPEPEEFDVPAQQAEIDRVSALLRSESKAAAKFKILKGAELGLANNRREEIREYCEKYEFDQIVASVHYLEGTDPYLGDYYKGKNWKEAYGRYLDTLYREMKWLGFGFDIMGHFDYIVRYAPYPKTSILYCDFPGEMDAILKYLAQEGKAFEINTRTYRKAPGRTVQLDRNVLLRYRELGGEVISLGSDSHVPTATGDNFTYWAQYVKSLGFRYLAHYESRRLKQVTI